MLVRENKYLADVDEGSIFPSQLVDIISGLPTVLDVRIVDREMSLKRLGTPREIPLKEEGVPYSLFPLLDGFGFTQ